MGDIITEQYRMHPDISEVVSTLFYNSELKNNSENEEKYLNTINRPFKFSICSDLPDLNKSKGFYLARHLLILINCEKLGHLKIIWLMRQKLMLSEEC